MDELWRAYAILAIDTLHSKSNPVRYVAAYLHHRGLRGDDDTEDVLSFDVRDLHTGNSVLALGFGEAFIDQLSKMRLSRSDE